MTNKIHWEEHNMTNIKNDGKYSVVSKKQRFPITFLQRSGYVRKAVVLAAPLGLAVFTPLHFARALNLYSGPIGGQDWEINLNTTVEYSNIFRVDNPSAVFLKSTNNNEGDEDFKHGLVSNELEVLPVFDAKDGNFDVHVSGEAYLNTVYLQKNQNNSPSTFNPISTTDNQSFTSATRNVNGKNAKLLDAFVSDSKTFGADENQTLTVKIGRQTLLWGQSLFFAADGISAGQAPIDIQVAQTTPNALAQQVFLPVNQAVLTYQPNQTVTLQAYYQFEWEPDNFEGVGSYFSSSDILDKGGQRLLLGPTNAGPALYRVKDNRPPSSNGQFGLSIQATLADYDLGLFALRYDSKSFQLYDGPAQPAHNGSATNVGSYWLVYPRDIQLYGASVSTTIGPVNVGGEISYRRNAPLFSGLGSSATYPGSANAAPLYAVGQVVDGQISGIYISPPLPLDPGGLSIFAEYVMNSVVAVDQNRAALAQVPNRQATAGAFQFLITPTYFFPSFRNVQVNFPIGLEYGLFNRSEFDSSINHGQGIFNVGVTAIYKTTWTAGLTYQDYVGAPSTLIPGATSGIADRGFVSFNIEHTF
jgi:hypothetical protein